MPLPAADNSEASAVPSEESTVRRSEPDSAGVARAVERLLARVEPSAQSIDDDDDDDEHD